MYLHGENVQNILLTEKCNLWNTTYIMIPLKKKYINIMLIDAGKMYKKIYK